MVTRFNKSRKRCYILLFAFVGTLITPLHSMASMAERPERPMYYTVEKGDSLWAIAAKNDTSPLYLAMVNGLNPDEELQTGERIFIPAGDAIVYEVQEGDTLWNIAKTYNITLEQLIEANGLREKETLKPGEKLMIRMDMDMGFEQETIPVFGTSKANLKFDFWPVTGWVSSNYGPREGRMHEGLDIAANYGNDIKALAGGVVVFAGERGAYGNAVIIKHTNGFRTLYAHSSSIDVKQGDVVEGGQVIAQVGSTGRSTGPHLHLEVLERGKPLDPELFLP